MQAATWAVLHTAWVQPFAIESNFARSYRYNVAFAASMGWLTTVAPDGKTFDRRWHITAEGIFAIKHRSD